MFRSLNSKLVRFVVNLFFNLVLPGEEQKLVSDAYLRSRRCCGGAFFLGTCAGCCCSNTKRSATEPITGFASCAICSQHRLSQQQHVLLLLVAGIPMLFIFPATFRVARIGDVALLWLAFRCCGCNCNRGSRHSTPESCSMAEAVAAFGCCISSGIRMRKGRAKSRCEPAISVCSAGGCATGSADVFRKRTPLPDGLR